MKISHQASRKARIEIIPMIDTIFFLLVFFMFSALSMVKLRGMSVALPRNAAAGQGASAGQPAPSHLVVLTVTGAGAYYLKRQPVDPGALRPALRDQLARDPEMAVVLNVAKSQSTQALVRIMDAVNGLKTPSGAGVKALIATLPVDSEGRAVPDRPAGSAGGSHAP